MTIPECVTERLTRWNEKNNGRFLAYIGSFPNSTPTESDNSFEDSIAQRAEVLGLMLDMMLGDRRYVFVEPHPCVHPSHRADITSLIFGELEVGQTDTMEFEVRPITRPAYDYTHQVSSWDGRRPKNDEEWVAQGYEDDAADFRSVSRMKPSPCCAVVAALAKTLNETKQVAA